METKRLNKGAEQRYLNALLHLYSNTEPLTTMGQFCTHHKIGKTFSTVLKEYKYIKKINGKYSYIKNQAPTIHDARFVLKEVAMRVSLSKNKVPTNKQSSIVFPATTKPTPASVPSTVVPNIWFYMAVIAMCTTLVTIALVLLK